MFIVNIPSHHGEEVWKRKGITSGRKNTSKPKLVFKPGNQTLAKRDHNRVSSHDREFLSMNYSTRQRRAPTISHDQVPETEQVWTSSKVQVKHSMTVPQSGLA